MRHQLHIHCRCVCNENRNEKCLRQCRSEIMHARFFKIYITLEDLQKQYGVEIDLQSRECCTRHVTSLIFARDSIYAIARIC